VVNDNHHQTTQKEGPEKIAPGPKSVNGLRKMLLQKGGKESEKKVGGHQVPMGT